MLDELSKTSSLKRQRQKGLYREQETGEDEKSSKTMQLERQEKTEAIIVTQRVS